MRQLARRSRIDRAGRADFHPSNFRDEGLGQMFRISFVFLSALMAAQVLTMVQASSQQGHDACARDVSRFCRTQMNDGDSAVLACLQQHRSRLSRACDKVLTDNGQ
jgi:hypothetical protein